MFKSLRLTVPALVSVLASCTSTNQPPTNPAFTTPTVAGSAAGRAAPATAGTAATTGTVTSPIGSGSTAGVGGSTSVPMTTATQPPAAGTGIGSVPTGGTTGTATVGGSAGAGAGNGAAGMAAPALTYAPTFTAIYNEIFQDRSYQCFLGPCHGMTAFAFADKAGAYMALINKPASGAGLNGAPGCNGSGKMLVVPMKPAESLLVQKVTATPPCGARMPLNGPPYLSDKQIEQLTKWVEMGAMNN